MALKKSFKSAAKNAVNKSKSSSSSKSKNSLSTTRNPFTTVGFQTSQPQSGNPFGGAFGGVSSPPVKKTTTGKFAALPKASSTSSPSSGGGYRSSYGGGGGSSGGGSASSGPTDEERKAAKNQTAIASQHVRDVQNQLNRQLANYDLADQQNRALANTQYGQNSRKSSEDRFEAQRGLQQAARGLLGSMGNAMNGSATGNLMTMLGERNDQENNMNLSQLQVNQDQVSNTLNDSLNQNVVARRDAMQSAEKAIRDIESDWRANMNNINPELYPGSSGPVGGNKALASSTVWKPDKAKQNLAQLSGYIMPDQTIRAQPTRNKVSGNNYFAQLMNRFNGR